MKDDLRFKQIALETGILLISTEISHMPTREEPFAVVIKKVGVGVDVFDAVGIADASNPSGSLSSLVVEADNNAMEKALSLVLNPGAYRCVCGSPDCVEGEVDYDSSGDDVSNISTTHPPTPKMTFKYESQKVKKALAEHRLDNNTALKFLEEFTTADKKAEISTTKLYRRYDTWARDLGYKPLTDSKFGKELYRRYANVTKIRRRKGISRYSIYAGIRWTAANSSN